MPVEIPLLEVARRRNRDIPRRGDKVYDAPFAPKLIQMRLASKIFVKGVKEVIGSENLGTVLELANTQRITIVRNHTEDLNHHEGRMAYEAAGYPELADRSLYYAGYKMGERPYINWFMGSEHTIWGPTPADFDNLAKALAIRDQLPDEAVEVLLKYEENLKKAGDVSGGKITELTKPGPKSLIYNGYPEGGRSYSGKVKDVAPETAASFGREGFFAPIVTMGGAERSLMPEHTPDPSARDWITMIVGEPFPKKEMWSWREEGKKRGEVRNPTRYLMARVAALLPDEYIEPQMLPIYREIAPRIAV